jgi:L,D-peptidoglycan transpeptidase YkuD (ErfK/YbiS/YcfS/YnhG family)
MEALVGSDGVVVCGGQRFRCAVGKGGRTGDKREGDGATPAGLLPLRRLLYRADRVAIPACALPREALAPADGWCDDPAHGDYNRQARLPHPARHEELWRADELYDLVGVLGWNDDPVERGRGSAIFLHVARRDYGPTDGCVALAKPDLLALLGLGVTALRVLG